MHVLNFEGNEKDTIYKILASVLHIGNIYFKRVHDSAHDTVLLGNDAEIKWISHLLQLSEDWLKQALTSKVTVSIHMHKRVPLTNLQFLCQHLNAMRSLSFTPVCMYVHL